MPSLFYEETTIPIESGQSVLDALLNADIDIPWGCRSGACQSCVAVVESGTIPSESQPGFTDAQKSLNLVLCCRLFLQNDSDELRMRAIS